MDADADIKNRYPLVDWDLLIKNLKKYTRIYEYNNHFCYITNDIKMNELIRENPKLKYKIQNLENELLPINITHINYYNLGPHSDNSYSIDIYRNDNKNDIYDIAAKILSTYNKEYDKYEYYFYLEYGELKCTISTIKQLLDHMEFFSRINVDLFESEHKKRKSVKLIETLSTGKKIKLIVPICYCGNCHKYLAITDEYAFIISHFQS
jgi:hypothetical protein